jgi:hypothetical protein
VVSVLLIYVTLLLLLASVASVSTVGWRRTSEYALQRIERDGVMSKGGNWNQFQLSNIPIALGSIGVGSTLLSENFSEAKANMLLIVAGTICIGVATVLSLGITALTWPAWRSFLNPRWLAHSMREIATYPLTGIPIALSAIFLVEAYLSGGDTWKFEPGLASLLLIGTSIVIVAGELILLRSTDILAIAQKPSFAPHGLSIPYLLCAHVFEHFLDFVFIGPLTALIYVLVRLLAIA